MRSTLYALQPFYGQTTIMSPRTRLTIDFPCSVTTHPGPPITCQQVCWTNMKISLYWKYCSYLCGLWGIQIIRGCRCSDSWGSGTAGRLCSDCAGNSCHLQRTGDQFDVPSSSTLTSVKWRATKFLNPISLLLTLTTITLKSTIKGKKKNVF